MRSHKSAVQVEEVRERQRQGYARERQAQYRASALEPEDWPEEFDIVDPALPDVGQS